MSYSSVTLAGGGVAYYDGALTVPQEVFPSPTIEYPVPGDQDTRLIRRKYHVQLSAYSPLELNTPDSVYTEAYLVDDRPVQFLPAGVVEIERTYCEVPGASYEYESYVFQFPGVAGGARVTISDQFNFTGISYCVSNGVLSWATPTLAASGLLLGQASMTYTFTSRSGVTSQGVWEAAIRAPLTQGNSAFIGRHAIVEGWSSKNKWAYSVVTASAATQGVALRIDRGPVQRVVGSTIESIYFLVGATPAGALASPAEIDLVQGFEVQDLFAGGGGNGYVRNPGELTVWNAQTGGTQALEYYYNRSSVVSVTSRATVGNDDKGTIPTKNEYMDMILTGAQIAAEGSTVERWQGNIYRRRTRYVKAQ
jgi:hypothetical protein